MSRLSPITPKQRRVLDYVTAHLEGTGFAPSQRWIAEVLRMTRSDVQKSLRALHHKGAVNVSGRPRGITVLENGRKRVDMDHDVL